MSAPRAIVVRGLPRRRWRGWADVYRCLAVFQLMQAGVYVAAGGAAFAPTCWLAAAALNLLVANNMDRTHRARLRRDRQIRQEERGLSRLAEPQGDRPAAACLSHACGCSACRLATDLAYARWAAEEA